MPSNRVSRQLWADVIRVAAVLLIFLYHFGYDWAASRDVGLSGFWEFVQDHFAQWGIAAFVILSGFALALTAPAPGPRSGRGSTDRRSYGRYLSRRLGRILGPFWLIAIPFSLAGFTLGEEGWRNLWKLPLWLLGLGIFHPSIYQPISEAGWYGSLALQISLLMPLLLRIRRSWGMVPLTVFAVAVNAMVLAIVKLVIPSWIHLDQGLVFSRLAELIVGIAAAELVLSAVRGHRDWRRAAVALGCAAFVMFMSPLLEVIGAWTGWKATVVLAGLFCLGALLLAPLAAPTVKARALAWAAAISYCFYLTHAPVSKYAGRALVRIGVETTWIGLPVVLIVCILVAWLADWIAARWVVPSLTRLFGRILVRRSGLVPPPDPESLSGTT